MQTKRFMSGPELASERSRRGVRAYELAGHLGVSAQRISEIERLYRVPDRQVHRYFAALSALAGEESDSVAVGA